MMVFSLQEQSDVDFEAGGSVHARTCVLSWTWHEQFIVLHVAC